MQNRGALWVFTILLALACLWQLSFSFFTGRFERNADQEVALQLDSVAQASAGRAMDMDSAKLALTNKYLRDHSGDVVFFGHTYTECKEREINLGLDLKGGMAVTLEVSIPELVANLADNSQDPMFQQALANARAAQRSDSRDFITVFADEFRKLDPNAKLAAIFHSPEKATMFPREASNEEVVAALKREAEMAINNTEKILRTRIDKFGVAQPMIQKQQFSGRIQVELPGVKDKDRVRKVLQSTANLEFYETFEIGQVLPALVESNSKLATVLHPELAAKEAAKDTTTASADTLATDSAKLAGDTTRVDSLMDDLAADSLDTDSLADRAENMKKNPLFAVMQVNASSDGRMFFQEKDVVALALPSDTAEINRLLRLAPPASPDAGSRLRLLWSAKPVKLGGEGSLRDYVLLHAIKVPRDGKAKLDGRSIVDARQDFSLKGEAEVSMQMDQEGAQVWKVMTGDNVGKNVAIVLDNLVYSSPVVQGEIAGGRSSITLGGGELQKQIDEANDLANILKAGALPAPARIIDETVVGASLGDDNIKQGMISFVAAMLLVMLFMILYYGGSGWIANIALLANIFLLMGTLASLQASLTLPGIAGIVLTVGMAVDANVLINERIREELRHGKMLKSAIDLGYKHAMSAIIDANVTHFVVAIILVKFGSGPIMSFGVTLALGILTSLFTAIFISRLIITRRLEKGKSLTFWMNWNKDVFVNAKYAFMPKRRYFYFASMAIIAAGLVSMFTQGFNEGVDFSGGREYVVKFQQPVQVEQVREALRPVFETEESNVKVVSYGGSNHVKVTTNFMVNSTDTATDKLVEGKLEEGLRELGAVFPPASSRRVDPTISDDIRVHAWYAVLAALVFIFAYVAVRFRTWQFGLGALLSLAHDALVVVALYSLLYKIMPFSLEIDEHFIAAILTVIGYSINDTVVVFDRIREYLQDHKREKWATVFDKAINSTLGRTINTSVTVLLVLLVIFLFGAESIKGFVFAMLVGIGVGTYSSIFIASAVVVDLHKDKVPEGASAPQVKA